MQLNLHMTDVEEMAFTQLFPDNYHFEEPVKERTIRLDNDIAGKVLYHEMFIEGFHIAYGDMRLKNKTLLQFESDFETIEMHFELMGTSNTKIDGTSRSPYQFKCNDHNVVYAPALKGAVTFGDGDTRTLEINMSPAIFEKHLGDSSIFQHFIKKTQQQAPSMLGRHNLPITREMAQVITGIIDCRKTGIFKRLYLESKVIELLLLQLEQFSGHDCGELCSLKRADIEKIHLAKDIMLRNAANPVSLHQLALAAGTNEFTLKKGFRELFGTTVFGMLSDIKMEEAKQYLINTDKTLSEISLLAGYQHPNHFSTAFKRKFGITPGRYRIR